MSELSPEALEYFKSQGQKGGKKSAKSLSEDQRIERARKAAAKSAEVRAEKAASRKKAAVKRIGRHS